LTAIQFIPAIILLLICFAGYSFAQSIHQKSIWQYKYIATPLVVLWIFSSILIYLIDGELMRILFSILSFAILSQFMISHVRNKLLVSLVALSLAIIFISLGYLYKINASSNVAGMTLWISVETLVYLYLFDKALLQQKNFRIPLCIVISLIFSYSVFITIIK
jgi:hypothetical protein